MGSEAVNLRVHGRVQGVFYRASAQAKGAELGLVGWVRNMADGSVEVHAEGEKESLEQFIQWCRQGPASAKVSGLDVNEVSLENCSSFVVR